MFKKNDKNQKKMWNNVVRIRKNGQRTIKDKTEV